MTNFSHKFNNAVNLCDVFKVMKPMTSAEKVTFFRTGNNSLSAAHGYASH